MLWHEQRLDKWMASNHHEKISIHLIYIFQVSIVRDSIDNGIWHVLYYSDGSCHLYPLLWSCCRSTGIVSVYKRKKRFIVYWQGLVGFIPKSCMWQDVHQWQLSLQNSALHDWVAISSTFLLKHPCWIWLRILATSMFASLWQIWQNYWELASGYSGWSFCTLHPVLAFSW